MNGADRLEQLVEVLDPILLPDDVSAWDDDVRTDGRGRSGTGFAT